MTISAEKISSPPAEAEALEGFGFRREEAERIRAIASSLGVDESEFIRRAVLLHAKEMEECEPLSVLSPDAYANFRAAVEAPGRAHPGLVRAIKESGRLLKNVD